MLLTSFSLGILFFVPSTSFSVRVQDFSKLTLRFLTIVSFITDSISISCGDISGCIVSLPSLLILTPLTSFFILNSTTVPFSKISSFSTVSITL
ncbi:hypothetical protein CNEONATNEC26_03386 [Clostridium neonatale]|nr:hypothetical protein CNEONATNEC26_03386 [Clostridium neonatale]